MDARDARYREAERRLWGSLGVVPLQLRLLLERRRRPAAHYQEAPHP